MPVPNQSSDDGLRRLIVRLVFAVFLLVLLEGVLRKWLLPSFEQPLLFIRDPLMLVMLTVYLIWRWQHVSVAAMAFLAVAAILLLLGLVQIAAGSSPVSVIIGLRFYLLFVPLVFIIPDAFQEQDLARLLRLALWIAIPTGVLVIAQFYSPVDAPINKGLSDEVAGRFQVVAGVVRPYGPFTFALGQATFAVFALACLLISVLFPALVRAQTWLLLLAGVAVLAMGALSGSRSFFVPALIVMAGGLVAVAFSPNRSRNLLLLVFCGAVFVFLFGVVFPEALQTMQERQFDAEVSEGTIFNRLWLIIADVGRYFSSAPVFGYGIGAGTNAAGFISAGQRGFVLSEYEWSRVFLELGPLFGSAMIGARIALAAAIVLAGLRAAMAGRGAPLVMAGFCAPLILVAQVTGNNGMVTLPWLAAGLTLALAKATVPETAVGQSTDHLMRNASIPDGLFRGVALAPSGGRTWR